MMKVKTLKERDYFSPFVNKMVLIGELLLAKEKYLSKDICAYVRPYLLSQLHSVSNVFEQLLKSLLKDLKCDNEPQCCLIHCH